MRNRGIWQYTRSPSLGAESGVLKCESTRVNHGVNIWIVVHQLKQHVGAASILFNVSDKYYLVAINSYEYQFSGTFTLLSIAS